MQIRKWIIVSVGLIGIAPAAQAVQEATLSSSLGAPTILELAPNVQVTRRIDLQTAAPSLKLSLGSHVVAAGELVGDNNRLLKQGKTLRAMPDLVTVQKADSELLELPTGLLVNQKLVYRVKPGACKTQAAKLTRAGVDCGQRGNLQKTLGEFKLKGSARYIDDPETRAQAEKDLADTHAEILADVKKTREFLNSKDAGKTLGQSELARLKALSDEDLAVEMLDNAETTIEETVFIPVKDNIKPFPNLSQFLVLPETKIPLPLDVAPATQEKSAPAPTPLHLGTTSIFLTGFTLGRNYEWKKKFSKTISWCYFGCEKTYWVEPYANLGYGFGLRFPIQAQLTYDYAGTGDQADLTPTFTPINGSSQQYQQAGLTASKLFEGKEFVAEYAATAGVRYKLPVVGSGNKHIGTSRDFTDDLPAPYTNGQFTPPAPGRTVAPVTKFLTNVDLLMGRGDYGVVGAKLFPGMKIDLTSTRLDFAMKDLEANSDKRRINSGQKRQVKYNSNAGRSRVMIGEPIYNLSFKVTPGVQYKVFVDLGVWGKDWRDELWIPQLQIELPPGGVSFACHAGTHCSRNYSFKKTGVEVQNLP